MAFEAAIQQLSRFSVRRRNAPATLPVYEALPSHDNNNNDAPSPPQPTPTLTLTRPIPLTVLSLISIHIHHIHHRRPLPPGPFQTMPAQQHRWRRTPWSKIRSSVWEGLQMVVLGGIAALAACVRLFNGVL
ncbi:f9df7b8e-6f41-452d-8f13-06bc8f60218b [Thermothielavioides terrestris]|uniref:F9df7b8e-6f41-452d-8f13-06bc8f60218b n=1 Tax=Thermothielavioides terrestris TaxID=2587410 RepID=A0A3S4C388_9PEZI|nr:f9df7b8e-6f41-452d-8f13-06bc8f60218b [Thermothielavioides terrestris]